MIITSTPSDLSLVFNDQVEPGIKNDGLTNDHRDAPKGDDDDVDIGFSAKLEVLQQESNGVGGNAPRREEQAPKV